MCLELNRNFCKLNLRERYMEATPHTLALAAILSSLHMKLLGLVIIVLAIVGCSVEKSDDSLIEEKLIKCYQEKFQDEDLAVTDPIIYYEKFEQYLIDNYYLKGRSKKDYLQLWDDIYDSTKVISIKEFGRQNGMTMMTANYPRSRYCYYAMVKEQKIDDKQLQMTERLLDEMDSVGNIGEIILNKKLINVIDERRFHKTVFRIPTLTYMYLTIENRNWKKYGR